jgi:hypothetical protein
MLATGEVSKQVGDERCNEHHTGDWKPINLFSLFNALSLPPL